MLLKFDEWHGAAVVWGSFVQEDSGEMDNVEQVSQHHDFLVAMRKFADGTLVSGGLVCNVPNSLEYELAFFN
jgi:hypothetical protein